MLLLGNSFQSQRLEVFFVEFSSSRNHGFLATPREIVYLILSQHQFQYLLSLQRFTFLLIPLTVLKKHLWGFINIPKVYSETILLPSLLISIFLVHNAVRKITFCHSHCIILYTQKVYIIYHILISLHPVLPMIKTKWQSG